MSMSSFALPVLTRCFEAWRKWSSGGPMEKAIRATASQYPAIGALKASLLGWARDSRVIGELKRAQEGSTEVDIALLSEVLLDHDFHGTAEAPEEARRIVITFLEVLKKRSLEDATYSGSYILGRQEEISGQILAAVEKVEKKVEAEPSLVTDAGDPRATTRLDAQIDVARKRLLSGFPREALSLLEEIERDVDRSNLAARILFRLITNRAACQLELGRRDEALAGFEAAHAVLPQDLKGRANLGLAHLIRGEVDKAESIAQGVLREEPNRCDALSVLAQVFDRKGQRGDAVQLLLPLQSQSAVRSTLALLYVNSEAWDDVQALLEPVPEPDLSADEVFFLGESYVKVAERHLKTVSPLRSDMPDKMLAWMTKTERLLNPIVNSARREGAIALLPALTLRASVRLMTDRHDEAILDLEEASRIDKAPARVFRNLGLAYMSQEDPAKAAAVFQEGGRRQDKEDDMSPLLVEALLANKQLDDAVREGKQSWEHARTPERRREAGLSYAMALAARGNGAEAESMIAALRRSFPDDPELELRWANALTRLGRETDAISILENQLSRATGSLRVLISISLGDSYVRCEQFNSAADAYKDFAHPVDTPYAFQRYLLALYKSGRWSEALEAVANARSSRGGASPPVSEAEIEGQILEDLGYLQKAQAVYEAALSSQGADYRVRLRLAHLLHRRDEPASARAVLDSALDAAKSVPRDLTRAAQLYFALGDMEAALKCSYHAVRALPADPHIGLAFIGFMFAAPEGDRAALQLHQEEVKRSSAVELEVDGRIHSFLVLDDQEIPRQGNELTPGDPLAAQLLGKRVGDNIDLNTPYGERNGTIRGIRHRYVAEFQTLLAQYPVRHPERRELVAIPVRDDFRDQVRSMVRDRADHTQRLFDAYKHLPITVGIVAERFGRTAFETLLALAQDLGMQIASHDGSKELEELAQGVLADAEVVVLDPTAVAALALLGLSQVPGTLKTRVLIPQKSLDEMQEEILRRRLMEGREYFVLSAEGDQLVRRVISAEEHEMGTQTLIKIRDTCRALEVAPRPVTPGKWTEWADPELLGPDTADAVAIARSSEAVLVSADGRLLGAVGNEYGVKTVSVYDLLQFFVRKGFISPGAFDDAVASLIWHGFVYTPVRASAMIRVLRNANYELSPKWNRMLAVLESPATTDESAIRVVGEFLVEMSHLHVSPPNMEAIARSCMEALRRERKPSVLVEVRDLVRSTSVQNWIKKMVAKCAEQAERAVSRGTLIRP